jgi:hypothetical protein
MSDFDRRQFLKGILGKLAQTAGTVVIVSVAASTTRAGDHRTEAAEDSAADIQDRANRLAAKGASAGGSGTESETAASANEFLNGGFRNTPLGAFRNAPLGGFRNTPLGAFRNAPLGGFRNTPLGAFANGGWPNGMWGGFNNGGWPNVGWRNW